VRPLRVSKVWFQSTLPVKGATGCFLAFFEDLVSIHAPSEGSDSSASFRHVTLSPFQSTLPVKGAT